MTKKSQLLVHMHQNSILAIQIQFNQADQISSFIDSWNQM